MVRHLLRLVKGILIIAVFSIPIIIITALCQQFETLEVLLVCALGILGLIMMYFLGYLVEEEF